MGLSAALNKEDSGQNIKSKFTNYFFDGPEELTIWLFRYYIEGKKLGKLPILLKDYAKSLFKESDKTKY